MNPLHAKLLGLLVEKVVGKPKMGKCVSDYFHIERSDVDGEIRVRVSADDANNAYSNDCGVVLRAEVADASACSLPVVEGGGGIVLQDADNVARMTRCPEPGVDSESWAETWSVDARALRALLEAGAAYADGKGGVAYPSFINMVALWKGSDRFLSVGSSDSFNLAIATLAPGAYGVSAPVGDEKHVCIISKRAIAAMSNALKAFAPKESGPDAKVEMWRNEQTRTFGLRVTLDIQELTLSIAGYAPVTERHPIKDNASAVQNYVDIWRSAVYGDSPGYDAFRMTSTCVEHVCASLKAACATARLVGAKGVDRDAAVFFRKGDVIFLAVPNSKLPPTLLDKLIPIGLSSLPVQAAFSSARVTEALKSASKLSGEDLAIAFPAPGKKPAGENQSWATAPLCVGVNIDHKGLTRACTCMRVLAPVSLDQHVMNEFESRVYPQARSDGQRYA